MHALRNIAITISASLCLLLVSVTLPSAGAADELLLLGGKRIKGVVVREGRDGVWIETEPYTAVHFPYEKVIRAEKWDAAKNDALMNRSRVPAPSRAVDGEEIVRTPEGSWFVVKPRIARFIPHTVSSPDSHTTVKRAAPTSATSPSRRSVLETLARQPEPLTQSQLSRRAGPPQRRERESDGAVRWYYTLGRDGQAVATFSGDGLLEDVFFTDSSDK